MRASRRWIVGSSLFFGVVACSSGSPTTTSGDVAPPPTGADIPSAASGRDAAGHTRHVPRDLCQQHRDGTSIKISGSGDPTGKTCTGATANTLCQTIHNHGVVANVSCDGNTWHLGTCCGPELSAGAVSPNGCSCSDLYVVRAQCGIEPGDVGRTNSCSSPTQTITVTCQ